MAAGGAVAALTIRILADTSNAQQGLSQAQGGFTAFGRTIDTGVLAKGAAIAGVVGLATTALIGMGKAAAEDAAEQDRLAQAMVNSGAATGDWQSVVDEAIAKGQELAFTDTQIRDALIPLTNATGDVNKATELLSLAQDVARLKGVDLQTATEAVTKAQNGQGTALGKLIGVQTKGRSATEILADAQRLGAGQAERYGNTTVGQAQAMEIGFSELTEQIGSALLPVFAAIMPALKPILKAFGELITALLPVLTPLLQLLAKVLVTVFTILGKVVGVIVDLVTWIGRAISKVGDFVSSLNPLKAVGDVIGGIFGQSAPAMAVPVVPVPMARAGLLGTSVAGTSVGAGSGKLRLSGSVTITHRVDDPAGVLAGLPGGAAAVAGMLNRGTEALGLYRSIQHAAGIS